MEKTKLMRIPTPYFLHLLVPEGESIEVKGNIIQAYRGPNGTYYEHVINKNWWFILRGE